MNRRKFLSLVSGAVAAVAGGLTAIGKALPGKIAEPGQVATKAMLTKMRGALDRTKFQPPCLPGEGNYKLYVSREVYDFVAEAEGWPKWEHVEVEIEG